MMVTSPDDPNFPPPPPGLFDDEAPPPSDDDAPERPRLELVDPNAAHWEQRLTQAKTGGLRKNGANATTIFGSHPEWCDVLAYDEFGGCVTKTKPPPWHADDAHARETGEWTEADTFRAVSWLSRRYALDLGVETVYGAIQVVAERARFHPVRAYLRRLEWDGSARLDSWLTTLFGVKDSQYTRAVGRMWLISAVARVMRPGSKVDTMLVLEGLQGKGKSTALRLLAGDEWFVALSGAIDPRETAQQLRRKWIVEFEELASFKKTSAIEVVKSFLSRVADNYRPPYGKRAIDFPRQCVCAGSTNDERYLPDPTGARRFWPVYAHEINLRGIEVERDQLWAEAVAAYDAGEKWHIEDERIVALAKAEQDARFEEDAWTDVVRDFAESRALVGVTTGDVLSECIRLERAHWTQHATTRVGVILRRMGWATRGDARPRRYFPPLALPPDATQQGQTGGRSNP